MKLKTLNSWQEINKNDYINYGIVETEFMKCEGAYLKNYQSQNITITLYNYGKAQENAFDEIEESLEQNEKENYLVDGNSNNPDYEDTTILSCIFKDRLNINGYNCLGLVSKILLPEATYSYVFQLYGLSNGNLYSIQFKFANFDESNIEKTLSEDETFNEVLNSIY
ncbi:MAG: hypothetical protein IJX17_02670 [Clostridia bacterium]|nr:hypothetical protein [Clostridia bacterium]